MSTVDNSGREDTARNSAIVLVFTLTSRATGLVRVLVIGALMGDTFFANIFQAGYVLPNTIHSTISGPILAMVLIPSIVRALDNHGITRSRELFARVGGRIVAMTAAAAALLMLASPLVAWSFTAGIPADQRDRAFHLTLVLILFVAPQVPLYALSALGVAAQQSRGKFALAAAAPGIENIGTIVTVLAATWIYGQGLQVNEASDANMIFLGVGTTASVILHAGLQMYGTWRVGLLGGSVRGYSGDADAKDAVRRVVRSIPIAVCPAITNYVLTVLAAPVAGGVLVVQLAYQVYYALSYLGSRAVSMAALPKLAQEAGTENPRRFGIAWRQALYYATLAGLPATCLLASFYPQTADLLANGEMREANLITNLGLCLLVAAFAQMAGGMHDFGRQALFSRLDDRGPRIASYVGFFVGIAVAAGTLLLPADGTRLVGLLVCVLAGEAASAITVLSRMRLRLRPESFINHTHVVAIGLATLAMAPVIVGGRWLLGTLAPERYLVLLVLLACGAIALAAFLAVVRYVGDRITAEAL
ncbi:hypothetical protein GCM10023321_30530 [Pseudonocardia eucalypti]|uniref:Peptidoglycan lipid II flippase n=1 Tax=Pseudonocardia eucalypti TaxID=648755 RepID=A0ABP9Q2E7_9PSEU|nr:peptidoglycan biosynthesis protein MviN/MurJ (putative lipid II flippase) [Pseudonocardia eucalypti]